MICAFLAQFSQDLRDPSMPRLVPVPIHCPVIILIEMIPPGNKHDPQLVADLRYPQVRKRRIKGLRRGRAFPQFLQIFEAQLSTVWYRKDAKPRPVIVTDPLCLAYEMLARGIGPLGNTRSGTDIRQHLANVPVMPFLRLIGPRLCADVTSLNLPITIDVDTAKEGCRVVLHIGV